MTGEWKECKLREIASEIKSGGTPSTKHQEYYGGIIPWLNTKEIHFNRIRDTDIKITEGGLNNSSAKWVKENSIIVAMYGATAGKIAINKIPLTTNQACCNITPDSEKADYNFVYYNLCHRYDELVNLSCGAAQQNLNVGLITNLDIILPPITEQCAIASVLSSLDDKIDLLHRQNKTLEAMAETLFRQWFVEEADEGWEEDSLLKLIRLVGGGTPKTSITEYWDGDIPWLAGGDIAANHRSFVNHAEKRITEAGLNKSSAKLLPKYATVISARGTVGKYCLLAEPMAFSQSNYGILPNIDDCFFFTYLLINHVVEELQSSAYGSVFDTITTATFKENEVLIPTEKEIIQFEKSISPYFQKMFINKGQIRTLEKLRDTLLPKLMSGEVRVELAQGEAAR
ncbi:restriction endonuclease subunit S [Methanosarcina mazei]|uniref:Type I restriction modification DNA specificity domain-containing protein n=1 Tax=Methanosarcina mazei TaxID=2209 RepID=A0A0F8HZF2_METMZ|nr:restriction endonuclease subunit S [Methanosarcina mazei]KKG82071.1 hypothetical protein DU55_05330 [Methanosarcina mazei]